MFLKNKWKNLGVKKKIFLWSTLTIIISFTLLYISIYFFMPKIYELYKVNIINEKIETLKYELLNNEEINIDELLDKFSYENNLDILLVKKDENKLINEIIYSSFREGANSPNKIPFLYNHIYDEQFKKFHQYYINKNINIDTEIDTEKFVYNLINRNKSLNIDEAVYIKKLKNIYNMIVHFPIKPQEELTESIELFLPFAIIAIIAISIIISSLYSILISRPLIKLNKVAKKMANLNFNNIIEINGEDEIGQLSNSLNLMNKNLKETFEKLEKVNLKLTKEIEMERKLEKERKEFVATISHELKSPITIISGQLEGMIYNIGKYKDRDKYLRESYDVTQNMKELVEEILHLIEREKGEFKYNFKNVNLSNIIKSVISELNYFIDEKNLKLKLNIDEHVEIYSDIKLIKKVITNIIKNSIIYSPKNEFIKIDLSKDELKVENTGVSIPEEQLKQIFNAFYRVDKSRNRKTGGTGLGLYIVKTILDKHKNIDYIMQSTENSVIFKMKFKYT